MEVRNLIGLSLIPLGSIVLKMTLFVLLHVTSLGDMINAISVKYYEFHRAFGDNTCEVDFLRST